MEMKSVMTKFSLLLLMFQRRPALSSSLSPSRSQFPCRQNGASTRHRLLQESPMMKPMLSENPSVLVLRMTLSSPCPATKLPPCTTLPLPDSNWEGSLHLGIINEALVKIPKPGVMCASQHLSTHTSVTHTIMPTYLFIYFSSIYLYSFSIY